MINLAVSRWVSASKGHSLCSYEIPYVITIQIIIRSTRMPNLQILYPQRGDYKSKNLTIDSVILVTTGIIIGASSRKKTIININPMDSIMYITR